MKAVLKKLTTGLAALLLMVVPALAVAVPAYGQAINKEVCKGVGFIDGGTGCDEQSEDDSFAGLAKRVVNIFSLVVGAVSVIMIIIGGFRYIISGGDSNGVTGAKNTILYAVVGLVIVLFAQIIVRFVLSNASN